MTDIRAYAFFRFVQNEVIALSDKEVLTIICKVKKIIKSIYGTCTNELLNNFTPIQPDSLNLWLN